MTKHFSNLIAATEVSYSGYDELRKYLVNPDRRNTLEGTWPAVVEPIANHEELILPKLHGLPQSKKCGSGKNEFDASDLRIFKERSIFSSICAQFRAVAANLSEYVEPPELPHDLFWWNSIVPAGRRQFIGWHTDGDVLIKHPGKDDVLSAATIDLLISGQDFVARHLYLQATLELPTVFASRISAAFDKNMLAAVSGSRSIKPEAQDKAQAWLEQNSVLTTVPAGPIIAFPSGVLHTGVAPLMPTPRTILVCRLNIK